MKEISKGVFLDQKKRLFTRNLLPGKSVYGEKLLRGDPELREWDPSRSKIGAGLLCGMRRFDCRPGSDVLYLGCSSGTTVSHISDIVGGNGLVFAVDIAARMMRDLVFLAKERKNIAPILGNANDAGLLSKRIAGCDVLIQDIAQKHQVKIFGNALRFMPKGSQALLSVKARSIDVSANPKKLFESVRAELESFVTVLEAIDLSPYEKDHMLFVCKKK